MRLEEERLEEEESSFHAAISEKHILPPPSAHYLSSWAPWWEKDATAQFMWQRGHHECCCGDFMQNHNMSGYTVNVLDYINLLHDSSLPCTTRFVCLSTCPYCGVPVAKVTAVFTLRMCRLPKECQNSVQYGQTNSLNCIHCIIVC